MTARGVSGMGQQQNRTLRAKGFTPERGSARVITISLDAQMFDEIADRAHARAKPFAAIARELLAKALLA